MTMPTHRASCKLTWEMMTVLLGLPHDTVLMGEFFVSHPSFIPMQEDCLSRRMSPEVTNHPRIICWKFDKDGPGVAMSYLTHPA